MHNKRLPRIRSIRPMLEIMERAGIQIVPPISQLRPRITIGQLKQIVTTWLRLIWRGELIAPDPWEVLARVYYSRRFHLEAAAYSIIYARSVFAAARRNWLALAVLACSVMLAGAGVMAYFQLSSLRFSAFEIAGAAIGATIGGLLGTITGSDLQGKMHRWIVFGIIGAGVVVVGGATFAIIVNSLGIVAGRST